MQFRPDLTDCVGAPLRLFLLPDRLSARARGQTEPACLDRRMPLYDRISESYMLYAGIALLCVLASEQRARIHHED
jgi:hypothetical protein